jgi:hypothetical protein
MHSLFSRYLQFIAPAEAKFYRIHLLYIVLVLLVGGAVVYGIEGSPTSYAYIDCAFIITACVTGGGLQTLDVTPMSGGSQAVLFIATIIGGIVLLSVVPATYRRFIIRRAARTALTSGPNRAAASARVQAYLGTQLEYRALGWVRALTLTYWAGIQLCIWLALGWYFSVFAGSAALQERSRVGPWWFSAFVTATGFANVGLVMLVSSGSLVMLAWSCW